MEKLRRFAFERVADKLQSPPDQKKRQRIQPQTVNQETCKSEAKRNQNRGNAQRVAHPVDLVLVTGSVLCDPLFASATVKHSG